MTNATHATSLTSEEMRARGFKFFAGCNETYRDTCIQVALVLQETHSRIAWHAHRAATDPDYWFKFATSQPNMLAEPR